MFIKSKKLRAQLTAFFIILAFFVAGITLFKSKQTENLNLDQIIENPPIEKEPEQSKPTVTLNKFQRSAVKDGKTLWEVTGDSGEYFAEDNRARIKNVVLNNYKNPARKSKITGDLAIIYFLENEIEKAEIKGNVHYFGVDMKIETEYAIFSDSDNTIIAPGSVKIKTETSEITGKGLVSNTVTEESTIDDDVYSKIKNPPKEGEEEAENKKESITQVWSKSLKTNNATGDFTYKEKVKTIKDDMTINSDILNGNYGENQELDELQAEGNVTILRPDAMSSKSDKADFNFQDEIITLTGSPEVSKQNSVMQADIIYYYIEEDRSVADGSVEVKMIEEDKLASKNATP